MGEEVTIGDIRVLAETIVEQQGAKHIANPLIASATVDDRFRVLSRIASPDHLHPWDLLPGARSLVVFFVPFRKELAQENGPGDVPCRAWGVAYVEANELITALALRIQGHLQDLGYRCAFAPPTHNFDPVSLTSRWSHKHLGHLVGLGRFGHNAQLITPNGCAGRLGSLVTEATLGDDPLVEGAEACLQRAGWECFECVGRCPVGALSRDGLDRKRCWDRLRWNREKSGALEGLPENTHVCGKCVVMLPCSHADPVAKKRPR